MGDEDPGSQKPTKSLTELGQLAADTVITAINDPAAQWDVLTEEEISSIKRKCEELLESPALGFFFELHLALMVFFSWFTYLDVCDLTNYAVVIPQDYLKRRQTKPCFDPHQMRPIAERFEEKGAADFEAEFGMTREQLILAILCAIMEDSNSRNVRFELLCQALQLDKGAYHMVKRFLVGADDDEKTPKRLILETLCSPIDCCLAITMAYCEVSGWPFSCDWSAITCESSEWTEENQSEFENLIKTEAKRQWDATKAFVMDPSASSSFQPSEHMKQSAVIENQLKAMLTTADKVQAEMQELITAMSKNAMTEKHEAVVNERREAINDIVPQTVRDRPSLTEEDLAKLDREIDEIRARILTVKKPSEWPAPPPEGLASKLALSIGEYCLARTDDIPILTTAEVIQKVSGTMYQVKFVDTGHIDEVETGDIAVATVPMYDPDIKRTNYIGLRVAALVTSPYFYNQMVWSTGTIGTLPNTAHNKEFLIFFDDGFEQYVQAAFDSCDTDAIRATAIDKGGVYQLIRQNPERRRFIQKYFEKYPDWPLAYNSSQDRVTAYVVATDRALCVLRFPNRGGSFGNNCFEYPCKTPGHVHIDETIFRGSSRIHAVNLEHFGSNNMSARRMAKNRSQFDVVQPGPCPDKLKTSSTTARKSSLPVRSDGGPEEALSYEMDPQTLATRLKKEAQFEIVPCSLTLPQVSWQYHTECSPVCLGGLERDPADPQFYSCSPLHIPVLCGWRRVLYMHESSLRRVSDGRILYRAPCGRSLSSKKCVATYLKEVGSELTIDLFCFDPSIETRTFLQVSESFVKTPDFTKGLENLPIPAVNTIDDDDPPKISYCARRFPYNHQVDVKTISRDYCSGCSCTDDCSDPLKCECQQLTVSNVQRLAKSFRPAAGEYGYSYRTLLGKTITALCDIPAGSFIANYVGALLTDSLADALHGEDEYFADLDLNDAVENEKATTLEKCGYLDMGFGSSDEEEETYKNPDDGGLGSEGSSSSSSSEEEGPKSKRGRRKRKEEAENVARRRKKLNQAELERSEFFFKYLQYGQH
ncbi:unnamed protein product [Heligmosomoides polygyrus]|uniref:MBD domain-containing protein n=1 Tax=Heligmosomoides polygyrus TaxID=6339 RepID=A0A3P8AV17_HELPZ|nr:unnamed protein product [Heligmosomoides polygyrus]